MRTFIALALAATPTLAQPSTFFTTESQTAAALTLRPHVGAIRAAAGPILLHDFPLPDHAPITLELHALPVIAPNARVVLATHHAEVPFPIDPDRYLFLQGNVADHPGSHVFISLGAGEPLGTIDLGPGAPSYAIIPSRDTPNTRAGDLQIVASQPGSGPSAPPTLCAVDHTPLTQPVTPPLGAPLHSMRQAELAIDADYEFYSLFDSELDAIDYIVKLYAQVSDITSRDVRTRMDLFYIRLWTTPDDPWGDNVSFPAINPNVVPYDVAQMISGRKDASAGGMAYVCGNRSWIAYSLGFFTDPTTPNIYNQDIHIAAHEIGHNLGTLHTQDYDLDHCEEPDFPPQRGTIMSYCSQTNCGGSSITDLLFHTTPRTHILECLENKPNIVFDCNQNALDDTLDILMGTSPDANDNDIPDECEDCNANGVLDDQDILSGFSTDLNENGLPDECEADCNGNGAPDDFDIATGISLDAYGNGVPDECETDCNANAISDYTEIQLDMTLDIDRNAVLDACQDCDADAVPDIIALEGANNAWAIASPEDVIKEYHAVTGVLMHQSEPGHLDDARDLLITPDARILVSSAADDRIVEFDRTGAYVGDFIPAGSGGLDEPGAMLLTPDATLLVASTATGSVLEYDAASGAYLGTFVSPTDEGPTEPYALAYAPNGNLLVSSSDNRILQYDPDSGAYIGIFISSADSPLDGPRAIITAPDGRVVVASQFTNNLLAFDPLSGKFLGQYNNGDYNGHLAQPWGLRVGPSGYVYAGTSDDAEDASPLHLTNPRILEYDPANGNLLFPFVQSLHAELNFPRGFDFMPSAGDCNRNLIPDTCDIAGGVSDDANDNAVPDECEDICYADLNDDAVLNILDFVTFQLAWQAQNPIADCDANQTFNILDFTCFQQLFQAGCP